MNLMVQAFVLIFEGQICFARQPQGSYVLLSEQLVVIQLAAIVKFWMVLSSLAAY